MPCFGGHPVASRVVGVLYAFGDLQCVLFAPSLSCLSDILVMVLWACWRQAGVGGPDEGGHGR